MGCWNETCMLSHTPIFCGDKIRAGLIAIRDKDFNATDPDGLFVPIAPLIEARYDDYGRPEYVTGDGDLLTLYRNMKYERRDPRDGEIKPWKPGENAAGADDLFADLFDAARHDGLYLVDEKPGHEPCRRRVFPVLILERFWELAQKSIRNQDLYLSGPVKDDTSFRVRLPGEFANLVRLGALDEKTILIPHLKLQRFMERARISWHFTCGSGSQEGFTPEMYAMTTVIRKYRNELRDSDF